MRTEARHNQLTKRSGTKLRMAIACLAFAGSACSSDSKPSAANTTMTTVATATTEVRSNFSGVSDDCEEFVVYAQNRWEPNGAAARTAPLPDEEYILAQGYPGEDEYGNPVPIIVDGWVDGVAAIPTNPSPYNKPAYFHVARKSRSDRQDVYVSFPGVRGMPTSPGMNMLDAATAAPLDPACEGVYTP